MSKLKYVIAALVPLMDFAAGFLEQVDENTSGADDNAAKALRVATAALKELGKER